MLERGLKELQNSGPEFRNALLGRFDNVLDILNRYISEIEIFNPAYGLVSVKNRQELVTKHILDSLAPAALIARLLQERFASAKEYSLADLGSGAGLPGIPLAVLFSEFRWTLVEKMKRRALFLCNTVAVLGLKNVNVVEETIERTGEGPFHALTFRALTALDEAFAQKCARLLVKDGFIAAYKGRAEKAGAEASCICSVFEEARVESYAVPGLSDERTMVFATLRGRP